MNLQRSIGPAVLGVAAIAVLSTFGVPVITLLPFLLVLACPLMMVFMMRGMDHGGSGGCHGSHDHATEPSRNTEGGPR